MVGPDSVGARAGLVHLQCVGGSLASAYYNVMKPLRVPMLTPDGQQTAEYKKFLPDSRRPW
jgi:hypothetical protein